MKAIVAGGFVWAFGCNGTTLSVSKFNPSTPTSAPTTTTYGTASAGAYTNFDLILTSAGDCAVAEMGGTVPLWQWIGDEAATTFSF